MIHKAIEATFNHSPRHRTRLYAAVCNVPKFDIVAAGFAIGAECRKIGLPDYPNPFPRGEKVFADWETGFNAGYQGQAKPESAPVPVKKSKARRAEEKAAAAPEAPKEAEAPKPKKDGKATGSSKPKKTATKTKAAA